VVPILRKSSILSASLFASSALGCTATVEVRTWATSEANSKTTTMVEQPKKRAYPASARVPVIDEYFGVKVIDEYRWLEDAKSPRVQEWNKAQ
jgi:hypothetical protein